VITTRFFKRGASALGSLALIAALAACGGGGSDGNDNAGNGGVGVQPPQPPASNPMPPASNPMPPASNPEPPVVIPTNGNAKVSIVLEAAGTTCAEGGIGILAGLDVNSNNLLDASEISKTASSCFVTPGAAGTASTAGMATLVSLTTEAAGANCPLGGRKLESGFDANANGTLEAGEVKNTQFLCTTATVTAVGADTLVTVTDEPKGANCARAGRKVSVGGTATPSYLCNAADPGTAPVWARVKSLVQQAAAGFAYIIDSLNSGTVTVTLPTAPAVGDVFRVRGESANAWKIAQNPGQTIGTRALPRGAEPGLDFAPGNNSTHSWWFAASSASGQKLAAVGNSFEPLHPDGVAAPGRVRTSIDGGLNWVERNTPDIHPPANAWASIASSADGTKLAVAGIAQTIWTSADSGENWIPQDLSLLIPNIFNSEFVSVSMTPDGSRMVAATLYTSSTGDGRIFTYQQTPGEAFGKGTWTLQTDASSVKQWRGVAMSADGNTLVAAAYIDGSAVDAGVYVSTDSGRTWKFGTGGTAGDPSPYRVAISADGTRMIMAERFGKIFTSSDSGRTWSAGTSEGGFNAVACSADGLTMMAVQANGFVPVEGGPRPSPGRDGKLLVSTNGGTSFTDRSGTPRWYRGAAMSADGNRLVAAVDGGPIYVSTSNRSTYGAAGSLTGGSANELTLRYLGDGLFNATATAGPAYTIN
jgi:hypothetical protein